MMIPFNPVANPFSLFVVEEFPTPPQKVFSDDFEGGQGAWTTIMEGFLSLYFLGGVLGGIYLQNNIFLIFHALLAIGFGSICYYSIRHLSLK